MKAIKLPGASERQRELLDVIARIAAHRPWQLLVEDAWVSITADPPLPAPFEAPLLSVLGAAGETFGLFLYEDEDAALDFTEAAERATDLASDAVARLMAEARAIVLELEPGEVPREPSLQPRLLRYDDGVPRDLAAGEEHEVLLAVLEAFASLLDERPVNGELDVGEPFACVVSGGRRVTLTVGDAEPALPRVDRESDVLEGEHQLSLAPIFDAFEPMLEAEDSRALGAGGMVLVQAKKADALRAAALLSGARLAAVSCVDAAGVPGASLWVLKLGQDAPRLLGVVQRTAEPALFAALRPPHEGEERVVGIVVMSGGARRRTLTSDQLVSVHAVPLVRPPEAVVEQLHWDDDDEGFGEWSEGPLEEVIENVGMGYGAFGFPPPPEEPRPLSARAEAGRNAPCPCGSGKKYKKCCLGKALTTTPLQRAHDLHALDRQLVRRILDFADGYLDDTALERAAATLPPGFGQQHVDVLLAGPWLAYVGDVADTPLARRFLEEARDVDGQAQRWLASQLEAPLSLWRVLGVTGGETLHLEDLLTGEERTVLDRSGARSLEREQVMLSRVVEHEGLCLLAGTHPLPLDPVDAGFVEDFVREQQKQRPGVSVDDFRRGELRAVLLRAWNDVASARLESHLEGPLLQNTDGEEMLLTEDRFAVSPDDESAVRAAVLSLEGAEEDGRDVVFLREGTKVRGLDNVTLGRASVEGGTLRLFTNSIRRADALRRQVEAACSPLVRFQARTHEDPTSTLGRGRAPGPGGSSRSEHPELVPDDRVEMLRQVLSKMRRRWLDENVPALGGLTPREAAKDPKARAPLERLLRKQELHARGDPRALEDVAFLRKELFGEDGSPRR